MYTKKEDIEKWLSEMYITSYTIRENNIVDVYEDVALTGNIKELPVQFGKIEGSFYCQRCKLTTLKGCPYYVNGDFLCFENKLTSLEYAVLTNLIKPDHERIKQVVLI